MKYIAIFFMMFFSSSAIAKEKTSPLSGSISTIYGKGFDLFSSPRASFSWSLNYSMDQKTSFSASSQYKNDAFLGVSRGLYNNKRSNVSVSGAAKLQLPTSKLSRDNDFQYGVNLGLGVSKKIRDSALSLSVKAGYNSYGEPDNEWTHYRISLGAGLSIPVIDKVKLSAGGSVTNNWQYSGDHFSVQSYSAGISYSINKIAKLSGSVQSASKTLAYDTLFDDDTSSYTVVLTFLF